MKIGILGSGTVGQTLAASLAAHDHAVTIGSRDPGKLESWRSELGAPVTLGTFAEAASAGEIIINATAGTGSLEALQLAGAENLRGKILLDISNPLDFSRGMPPSLTISNTDSLGEQIQGAFPETYVVKTLNTMTAAVMVDPGQLADGDHHVFVSGNDAAAKARTSELLAQWFGWKHIIDLGDITTARGTEMVLPLWLRLWGALGTGQFNFKIVR